MEIKILLSNYLYIAFTYGIISTIAVIALVYLGDKWVFGSMSEEITDKHLNNKDDIE